MGETISLTATVLPSDADETTVTYSSSDGAIATVNSSGEVKGIAKGSVIIYVTAGEVKKEVPLTVYVATTEIKLNSTYLVLKRGGSFNLNATVSPEDAEQALTYKSLDTSVASVSSSGCVTASGLGSTSIIVSNEDMTVSVSVIVGKGTVIEQVVDSDSDNVSGDAALEYDIELDVSEYPLLDTKMLKYYYQTDSRICVRGDGYNIYLDGEDIVNWDNELRTDIELTETDQGMSFTVNAGESLCGPIRLNIDEVEGGYLCQSGASLATLTLIKIFVIVSKVLNLVQ